MKEFFSNIGVELKKIQWPTDQEMKTSSIQVFVFMILFSLFFWGLDALIITGVDAAIDPPAIFQEVPTDEAVDTPYGYDEEADAYYYEDASVEEDSEEEAGE